MEFKISKWQILFILLGGLLGLITGAFLSPTYYCIRAPCPQPTLGFAIIGFFFGILIMYIFLLILNNTKKR
ncbi:hypothetical protein HY638_03145 [Candidatus Woesearchaeota archaeon]|nr:hypothetical protein [Candidatus Woesearchaeota archaeon]